MVENAKSCCSDSINWELFPRARTLSQEGCFRPLYLALVRPILECDQQASSPYLQRDIALMQRIQRRATCMVKDMRELPHQERLRRLNRFFLSSSAVFAETSSSPTTSSKGALNYRKRSFSRPKRNGTYEGMTSRYVTVVSFYSGGNQHTP